MNQFHAPATINAATAKLPAAYEGAKNALSHCVQIDECKDWADKAQALASYAKQANDEEMVLLATRIRARAIRRAGELLKQIDGQGARTDKLTEVDHGKLTQRQAAANAGFSEHQQLQAVRIANVDPKEFDKQTDGPKPPTLSQLAQQGIKRPAPRPIVDLEGRDPGEYNRAMHFIGEFTDYLKTIRKFDLEAMLPILIDEERKSLRSAIAAIDAIHDRIVTRI